ncbi:tectonic-2 isoform X2 [Heptranchias perlo]|uniref:tectonic-2 isoform X2 n=1 Tax=Heptranchias perlo TaxID=212740 RepID=UPI0035599C99
MGRGPPAALAWVIRQVCLGLLLTEASVVFQPPFMIASGPEVNVYLVGEDISIVTLGVETVAATDDLSQSDCVETNATDQWVLTSSLDETDRSTLNVLLTLKRLLVLCENVSNETNCCLEPLCIVETLRVTACLNGNVSATLFIQVLIYVNSTFRGTVNENKMLIPQQKYQPLGPCPCNLTARACDVRCCCDEECTPNMIQLFNSYCFTGVFGGNVSVPFDQLCSVQTVDNPDWFPFLCVQSSLVNSPYLGLFYDGNTVVSQDFSFEVSEFAVVNVPIGYHQGDPIVRKDNEYFAIPQRSLSGQCLRKAPVAYLEDFDTRCVTPLTAAACTDSPRIGEGINNGQGDLVMPDITYQNTTDLSNFITAASSTVESSPTDPSLFPEQQNVTASLELVNQSDPKLLEGMCENMILGAEYVFFWKGTTISKVTLLVTVGNVPLDSPAILTQRFSATFINSINDQLPNVTRSGNPGYQTGKPVLAASISGKTLQKAPLSIWRPVGNGLCSSAHTTSVLFGEDSTSGCLLRLSSDNFRNCTDLRYIVHENLLNLVSANYVARRGNSDSTDLSEWVPLFKVPPQQFNDSVEDVLSGCCTEIPANLNIRFITAVIGAIEGVPQREILGAEVNFSTVPWQMQCGGGNSAACGKNYLLQSFSVSTSVQFIQIPAQPEPMETSFQINYVEYDCSQNDVCWPELAYPLTRRYTGEAYSQSIAQGMVLVFLFLVTAILGSPWNTIRKAWNSATFY